jgi:hypothetical protein
MLSGTGTVLVSDPDKLKFFSDPSPVKKSLHIKKCEASAYSTVPDL